MPNGDDNQPQRAATDESLAGERRKTDAEIEKRSAALRDDADAVVTLARKRADDVLGRARASADQKLEAGGQTAEARATLDDERRHEDDTLRKERRVEDDALADEREGRRRALVALLALERAATDRHLLLERDHADASVGSRDDFLAMTSHDLRNILGGIALSTGTLLRAEGDTLSREVVEREAQRIQRYTARMTRLVSDLVDVTSIEAGRLAIVTSRHDATELLRETIDAFHGVAAGLNISLRTEVKADAILARCDHERILQVLANVVGNAIKFTPEHGRIDILVERVDGDVRFVVMDTGPGIHPDKLSTIFERFSQADDNRSGLGLGLYISRCIVEAHGGKIWAESQVGLGSRFFFTLPSEDAGDRSRR